MVCYNCEEDGPNEDIEFKITFDGIEAGTGICPDCTSLNGMYYLQFLPESAFTADCLWYAPVGPFDTDCGEINCIALLFRPYGAYVGFAKLTIDSPMSWHLDWVAYCDYGFEGAQYPCDYFDSSAPIMPPPTSYYCNDITECPPVTVLCKPKLSEISPPTRSRTSCSQCECGCDGEAGVCTGCGCSSGHSTGLDNTLADLAAKYSSGISSVVSNIVGYNWQFGALPRIGFTNFLENEVVITMGTSASFWFDVSGDDYITKYNSDVTLYFDREECRFVFTDCSGGVTYFNKFGKFLMTVSPGGEQRTVTDYNASGNPLTVERIVDTVTDTLTYAYDVLQRVTSVIFTRTSSPPTNIRKINYTYYGSSESYGSLGDLKTVTTQIWDGSSWQDDDVNYYRYYKSGDTNGVVHGLKYVLMNDAYQRLKADPGVSNPLTATNTQVATYADNYYEYDSNRRATKSVIQGGLLEYTYSYTTANYADYNVWLLRTTVTRPDGSQEKVYSNYLTQTLLTDLFSGGDHWINYYQYDSRGNQILHAMPSAVVSYDDTDPGLDVTLQSTSGLINITDYASSTTATESTAGDVKNFVKAREIKEGSSGTAIKLSELKYFARSASDGKSYPVAEEKVYRNDNGTGSITTSYAYTWHTDLTQVEQKTTTFPAVTTAQNGSNSTTQQTEIYDTFGHLIWLRDPRGFITNYTYDDVTGAMTQQIADCDGAEITLPSGWTTPVGGGLHLISDFEHDELGRIIQSLGPEHDIDGTTVRTASWTVFKDLDRETWSGAGYATGTAPSYTYTLVNPVSINQQSEDGKTSQSITATRSSTSGKLSPSDSFPQSNWVRLSVQLSNDQFQQTASRLYHDIPSSGDGTLHTNYEETTFAYDEMDRQNRTVTSGGTITRTVYDVRGLTSSVYVGTDDAGATDSDPTGGGTMGNNMVPVSQNEYDGGADGGDGNLTETTALVDGDSGHDRVTGFTYDFRNRQTIVDGEIDLCIEYVYDNLNRQVQVNRYNTSVSSGNLIGRQETLFDELGRAYRSLVYAVTVGSGTVGDALASDTWFDASGNPIKQVSAGAKNGKAFVKTQYDGIGRQIAQYVGYYTESGDEPYSEVDEITSDNKIFSQTLTTYDEASNVLVQAGYQRFHSATGNGALNLPTASQPKARVSYAASWYDEIGRTTASANYGTNAETALSRPTSAPSSSDTVLVSLMAYNDQGEAFEATDPSGTVMQTTWDDAGRKTKTIENYVNAGPVNSDTNVETQFTYNYDGRLETLTAKNATTGDQTTTYDYGVTLTNSFIASNDLLASETYPDSVDSDDKVFYEYNRQGQRIQLTDQNGSVHEYSYDKLSRLIVDQVTTLANGVDDRVLAIGVSYEARGLVEKITSYGDTGAGWLEFELTDWLPWELPDWLEFELSGSSSGVVNEVQNVYNDFQQLIEQYQAHSGEVNAMTSPKVQYAYEDGSANTIRLTQLTYPNGRELTYGYGSTDGDNDLLGRVESIIDDDTTHLADYVYLGLSSVVQVDYTEPEVRYDLVTNSTSSNPYGGLDRFGRVVDLLWQKYSGTPADLVRLGYGYDRVSNRTWREDFVAQSYSKDFDELYTYDGLHRLQDMQRGLLNGGHTAIQSGTLEFQQQWALDTTGNWSEFNEDEDGSGSWSLEQSRTHNEVNEITVIAETVGPSWISPEHDRNGNMTVMPQPVDPTEQYDATYDAWNRLAKLMDGVTTVGEYAYDGQNWRTKKIFAGEARHFFYSSGWQALEERVGSETDPEQQYLWGLRYIDDVVLRDRDTDNNGSLDERLYGIQDANWNMVAVANASANVEERYIYSAFGVPTTFDASFYNPLPLSRVSNAYTFTGRELDVESSLMSFRARYYAPLLGRFSKRDPIGYVGGTNLYRAVFVPNGIDPLGLDDWPSVDEWPGGQKVFDEWQYQKQKRFLDTFANAWDGLLRAAAKKYCIPVELLFFTIAAELIDFEWNDILDWGDSVGPAQLNVGMVKHYNLDYGPAVGGFFSVKSRLKRVDISIYAQAEKLDKMIQELCLSASGGGDLSVGNNKTFKVFGMSPDYKPFQPEVKYVNESKLGRICNWNWNCGACDRVQKCKDPSIVWELIKCSNLVPPGTLIDARTYLGWEASLRAHEMATLIGVFADMNDRQRWVSNEPNFYEQPAISVIKPQSGAIYDYLTK